jgi:hypothetical protein
LIRELGGVGQEIMRRKSPVLQSLLFDISTQYGQRLGRNLIRDALAGEDITKLSNEEIAKKVLEYRKASIRKYFPGRNEAFYESLSKQFTRFESVYAKAFEDEKAKLAEAQKGKELIKEQAKVAAQANVGVAQLNAELGKTEELASKQAEIVAASMPETPAETPKPGITAGGKAVTDTVPSNSFGNIPVGVDDLAVAMMQWGLIW